MIFKLTEKYENRRELYFIDNYSKANLIRFDQSLDGTKTISAEIGGVITFDREEIKMLLEYYEHEHTTHLQTYIADKNNTAYFDALTIAAAKWKEVLDPNLQSLGLPNFEEVDLNTLQVHADGNTLILIK